MSSTEYKKRVKQQTEQLIDQLVQEEMYSILKAFDTTILRIALRSALHFMLLDNNPSETKGDTNIVNHKKNK